ncbi:MAG: flagellar biosynthesis protein FlhA [Treponema sp.]
MANRPKFWDNFLNSMQTNAVAVAVVVTVLLLFLPLPKALIDGAMVINLAISLIILLTVIYTPNAADFSSFPRVILFTTLFGLAINISSTRLILTHPVTGSGGAINMSEQSEMVKSFANIVTGDNVLVGFIIFIIIIVVQVVVVTKGASRVSEVAARFTLDSMNNKMFDVQSELNAGAITEEEAKKQKAEIRKENAFYAAMDGSSKFVSGNVKAGIFITVLNLVGGIVTGMVFGKMDFSSAINSYAKLTIGDGLMSQLPSLMLSFATGLLVTGSNAKEMIGDQLKREFSVSGTMYLIVGATLIAMGLAFHNLSAMLLIPVGGLFIYLGIRMQKMKKKEEVKKAADIQNEKSKNQTGSNPDDVSPIVTLDPLSLDLGYALIPLVDKEKGAELLERVTKIRRESALDLGLVVPPIRIRDNMSLDPSEYSFKIRGIEEGRSKLRLGYYMCINTGNVPKNKEIAGDKTKDPSFGMDAIWVPEDKRSEAESAGYAIVDPPTIIATHLTEIIRHHAADILGRQEVSAIMAKVKETTPVVVDEVMSGKNPFTYGEIEMILKNLLAEQVSIRNMVTILETLANFAPITKDLFLITEKVREALGLQICLQYADENKVLHVLTLSPSLSQNILEHKVSNLGEKPYVAFDPVDGRKFTKVVSDSIVEMNNRGYIPIILCASEVRYLTKSATERDMPKIVVLSINEVVAAGSQIKIESFGEINV